MNFLNIDNLRFYGSQHSKGHRLCTYLLAPWHTDIGGRQSSSLRLVKQRWVGKAIPEAIFNSVMNYHRSPTTNGTYVHVPWWPSKEPSHGMFCWIAQVTEPSNNGQLQAQIHLKLIPWCCFNYLNKTGRSKVTRTETWPSNHLLAKLGKTSQALS